MEEYKWFTQIDNDKTKTWRTVYSDRGGHISEEFEFSALSDGTFVINDCLREAVYMSKEAAESLYAFLAAQLKKDEGNV